MDMRQDPDMLSGVTAPDLHPLTLRFRGERQRGMEEEYRATSAERQEASSRVLLLIAVMVYSLFGFYDITYPDMETVRWLLTIRFLVTVPLMLLFLLFTHTRLFLRYREGWVLLVGTLMAISITGSSITVAAYPDQTNFVGIILTFFALVLIFVPSFPVTVLLGLASWGVFLAGDMMVGLYDPMIRLKANMFFFTALAIGSAGIYLLERASRESYFYQVRFDEETRRTAEAEKLESVRRMARTVAHEFNSPLSVILGAWDFGVKPDLERADHRKREVLEAIPRAVHRMSGLVDRLLTVTRLRDTEYVQGMRILDLEASSTDADTDRKDSSDAEGLPRE